MENELQGYKDRQQFWTEISVAQLSITNNLLLTISTGFLAFCFDKQEIKDLLLKADNNSSLFFYFLSLVFIALSTTLGIGVLFCRLYDFRISRHLSLTRKRFFEKHSNMINIEKDNKKVNLYDRVQILYKILFHKFPYIDIESVNNYPESEKIFESVKKLKRHSKVLGSATWLWTKIQVLYFFCAVICYVFHFIF